MVIKTGAFLNTNFAVKTITIVSHDIFSSVRIHVSFAPMHNEKECQEWLKRKKKLEFNKTLKLEM